MKTYSFMCLKTRAGKTFPPLCLGLCTVLSSLHCSAWLLGYPEIPACDLWLFKLPPMLVKAQAHKGDFWLLV